MHPPPRHHVCVRQLQCRPPKFKQPLPLNGAAFFLVLVLCVVFRVLTAAAEPARLQLWGEVRRSEGDPGSSQQKAQPRGGG